MNRRNALKNLGILTGSIVLFPSCDFSEEKVSLALGKFNVMSGEEALMKELVSCMIPEGDFSGAGSLNIQDFVWVMADDCLDEASQTSFLEGLHGFDDGMKKLGGKSFLKLTQEERVKNLSRLELDAESDLMPENENLIKFVQITKYFTILGYMNSEYIMTGVMPYSLVPGSYGTCESIDNSKRININA